MLTCLLVSQCVALSACALEATACGHHDYPPWNWQRGNQIVGACVEVVRRAFEKAGVTVRFNYVGPWKRCQALIQNGDVDINICALRNTERESYSKAVEVPMGINPIVAFVRKGREFPLQRWEDLSGKSIGLVVGVSMGPEFDEFLQRNTRLQLVSEPTLNLRKLMLDRVDVVPLGLQTGLLQIDTLRLAGRIVPLAKPLTEGKLHISVSNRSSWLLPYLDTVEQYLARPEYRRELAELLGRYHSEYLADGMNTNR
ncbi:transporter substrate-binding domain-containing protein [Chitinivorax sp. B]|uniref:substrate-binding periplasmic protein n=1 Tax=Chitinivorax sp. B TaxID=2502235 RepID=UPI0010F9A04B|nr:transporter substrate-binding domain-containing protein [Chitinivorax sp. B]